MPIDNIIYFIVFSTLASILELIIFMRKFNIKTRTIEFKVLFAVFVNVLALISIMILSGYYMDLSIIIALGLAPISTITNIYCLYIISKILSKNKKVNHKKTEDLMQIIDASEKASTNVSNVATMLAASANEINSSAEEIAATTMEIVTKTQNQENTLIKINKMTDEIKVIAKIITNISEQTNLLALNASIEAGRAGEHGRGFAVVAEKVQKLAEESKNSVERTSDIVESITKNISGATMDSVDIARGMEEISTAAEEQTASMEEISATAAQLGRESLNLTDLLTKKKYK